MKLNYKWTMKDDYPTEKNGYKVFSCFACGGGSTMGYKLAGFEVIGCNEIDPKMNKVYVANHNPKFNYLEGIQTFKLRDDLPEELYNLDILDGSPPCSSFSMAGNREKDWGKEKKFKEGQAEQVLDTLFFDFIDLAEKLKPKVVIAENVKGLLMGEAQKYVNKILQAFDKAGYYVSYTLLNASKMGVPQRRERVFFTAVRKNLYKGAFVDLFQSEPELKLVFNEKLIKYKEIEDRKGLPLYDPKPSVKKMYGKVKKGKGFAEFVKKENGKASMFSSYRLSYDCTPPTMVCEDKNRGGYMNPNTCRQMTFKEICLISSFPTDYKVDKPIHIYRYAGMSVPPLMTARIAYEVQKQWLDKLGE